MGIDFKKVGKFISENRGYIFYGLSAIFTAVIGARYGINVGTVGGGTSIDLTKPLQDTIDLALNSKQAAVSSLRSTALNTTWSNDKKDAIKKIYEVIKDSKDEPDRVYAIRSIQAIANSTTWSDVKNFGQAYITAIAKGGTT